MAAVSVSVGILIDDVCKRMLHIVDLGERFAPLVPNNRRRSSRERRLSRLWKTRLPLFRNSETRASKGKEEEKPARRSGDWRKQQRWLGMDGDC